MLLCNVFSLFFIKYICVHLLKINAYHSTYFKAADSSIVSLRDIELILKSIHLCV